MDSRCDAPYDVLGEIIEVEIVMPLCFLFSVLIPTAIILLINGPRSDSDPYLSFVLGANCCDVSRNDFLGGMAQEMIVYGPLSFVVCVNPCSYCCC